MSQKYYEKDNYIINYIIHTLLVAVLIISYTYIPNIFSSNIFDILFKLELISSIYFTFMFIFKLGLEETIEDLKRLVSLYNFISVLIVLIFILGIYLYFDQVNIIISILSKIYLIYAFFKAAVPSAIAMAIGMQLSIIKLVDIENM